MTHRIPEFYILLSGLHQMVQSISKVFIFHYCILFTYVEPYPASADNILTTLFKPCLPASQCSVMYVRRALNPKFVIYTKLFVLSSQFSACLWCQTAMRTDWLLWITVDEDVIKWKTFSSVTGPLCGEFTGDRWIPHTKASEANLWCFPWCTHE